MSTLHLMTQRGQPYGSVRKCCEICGLMLVARDAAFWGEHAWTDEPSDYKAWPPEATLAGSLIPCQDANPASTA